ncbi:MAG: hypothetical protein U0166_19120 [Acidobacteriota bacterium]
MDRRQRQWSTALSRLALRTHELEREVRGLQERESALRQDLRALERRAAREVEGREPVQKDGKTGFGPVIHVYLVNGQNFYGVVNAIDDDNFSITLSNSAGRVLIIPKRNILYYRMKY